MLLQALLLEVPTTTVNEWWQFLPGDQWIQQIPSAT